MSKECPVHGSFASDMKGCPVCGHPGLSSRVSKRRKSNKRKKIKEVN